MQNPSFQYDFFISYERSISEKFALKLQHELSETFDKNVFIDKESIKFGDNWEKEIRAALKDSHTFVVLLPLASNPSIYVESEVTGAIELARSDPNRKIVPVLVDESNTKSADWPLGLNTYQGIFATEEGGVREVAEKLASDNQIRSKYPGVNFFLARDLATQEMLNDLSKATHAYFMGISHSKLWSYLQQIPDNTSHKKLPLKHVEIYFAHDELGKLIEPSKFSMNVREAILQISIALKSHPRFSDLNISFYQFPHILTPSGSRFKLLTDGETVKDLPFSVIYNVFVERGMDLSASWTMSMHYTKRDNLLRDIFLQEVISFERLSKSRKHLFTVSKNNVWDQSGEAWNYFELEFPVYENIYNKLWDHGQISPDHKVLDFGSGTGASLQTVAEKLQEGSLTLVDTSPGMLRTARETFSNNPHVNFVLGDACSRLFDKNLQHKYDRITSCLSLQSFADNMGSLHRFAKNCNLYIAKDGRVIIGVHNSFIDCDPPEGFETWEDPFRAALINELMNRKIPIKNPNTRKRFTQNEIIEAFEGTGFICDGTEIEIFPRTIEDRVAMWLTPAVFDSIADINDVTKEQHHEIVEKAGSNCIADKAKTMPTTVVIFCFNLK